MPAHERFDEPVVLEVGQRKSPTGETREARNLPLDAAVGTVESAYAVPGDDDVGLTVCIDVAT